MSLEVITVAATFGIIYKFGPAYANWIAEGVRGVPDNVHLLMGTVAGALMGAFVPATVYGLLRFMSLPTTASLALGIHLSYHILRYLNMVSHFRAELGWILGITKWGFALVVLTCTGVNALYNSMPCVAWLIAVVAMGSPQKVTRPTSLDQIMHEYEYHCYDWTRANLNRIQGVPKGHEEAWHIYMANFYREVLSTEYFLDVPEVKKRAKCSDEISTSTDTNHNDTECKESTLNNKTSFSGEPTLDSPGPCS